MNGGPVDDDEGGFNSGLAGGYSWEEEYRRSWEILQEDESGSLRGVVAQLQQQLKRRRQAFGVSERVFAALNRDTAPFGELQAPGHKGDPARHCPPSLFRDRCLAFDARYGLEADQDRPCF